MHTEGLSALLSAIHPLTEQFKNEVEKAITPLSLPRNYMLLEAPKVSGHAYFLLEGFAISYIFVKGEKQVESFWNPGDVIVSVKSFIEQVPSREFIQLRENSEILCVSYFDVVRLFETFREANTIYRLIMNQYYEESRQRTRDMQHLKARQRYEKLTQRYPKAGRYVTQEEIASYLGISPQSLSRIKRQTR